jgi:hypothetical protein
VKRNRPATYAFPAKLATDSLAYSGMWRVESQRIVAGTHAKLRLHFRADDVYLVLGGMGKVNVLIDGRPTTTVGVDGQRLYTLRNSKRFADALLELRFTPGLQAYAFTFG